MLRTAQSLPPTGLSTLGFDPARYQTEPPACYRAPWRLPGRDSHPLATTSLSSDQVIPSTTSDSLGTRRTSRKSRRWFARESARDSAVLRSSVGWWLGEAAEAASPNSPHLYGKAGAPKVVTCAYINPAFVT
jgi:hypothetical protein